MKKNVDRRSEVFISATSKDLGSVREMVRNALLTIGCHPVEQSTFPPDYRQVEEMLKAKIAQCDAVIHIVGVRYGEEPPLDSLPEETPRRSYTQLEAEFARQLGKKVYTFVCPETFPFDEARLTAPEDDERQALQKSYRQRILDDRAQPRTEVTDPAELGMKIRELNLEFTRLQDTISRDRRRITSGLIALGVLLAALTAGVWWSVAYRTSPEKNVLAPLTLEQKNALKELTAYVQMHLGALDVMYETMRGVYTKEGKSYLEGKMSPEDWQGMGQWLDHCKEKIGGLTQELSPLPETAAAVLSKTAVPIADVRALHDLCKSEQDEYLHTLDFVRHVLDPDTPMDKPRRLRTLELYDEMLAETGKSVYYSMCELFLPVLDTEAVNEFRSEALPNLKFFDSSYDSGWTWDLQTLRNAEDHAAQRLQSLMTDLAAMVGTSQNEVDSMQDVVNSTQAVLSQVMSDWRHLDDYVAALDTALPADTLKSIANLWNGETSVAPDMRKNSHEAQCKQAQDAVAKTWRDAMASVSWTPELMNLCEKAKLPADAVRAVYDGFKAVGDKQEWLINRLEHLSEAANRLEVEEALKDVEAAKDKILGWAGLAHVAGLKFLLNVVAPLQEEPKRMLATFRALKPNELQSPEALSELERTLAADLAAGLDQGKMRVDELRQRIEEKKQALEEARARVRKKCEIAPDDEPGLVTGKARRLREAGLIDDSVAAFERYGKMFGNGGPEAEEHLRAETVARYVKEAVALTKNLAEFGIEGGAFVFAFKDCPAAPPFTKYDVAIKVNGHPTKDADTFFDELHKAKAEAGDGKPITVTVLRLDDSALLKPEDVTYVPDGKCQIGVLPI